MLEKDSIDLLRKALETLESGIGSHLDNYSPSALPGDFDKVIQEVASRMADNFPYFHPQYVGQMLKPPHPIARTAYMLAMWINPNNHALDGGRASSQMEKEAVAELASMFGWKKHLGHLTGGGTMANMEALWVARHTRPGEMVVGSAQAHYTHSRISEVLNIDYQSVPTDAQGRMDLNALEETLTNNRVGTVVVTMGTTGLGVVDPLPEILELKKKYHFRIHADAAYGGYFRLLDNLETDTIRKYRLLEQVDSIVIDPHKHGLQPYGCGCVLFQDSGVAKFYLHDSPYTYFSSDQLHLGEISLECSRAGASAVALWATQRLLPPIRNGIFSQELSKCREAAIKWHERLSRDGRFLMIDPPETDIVVWTLAGESATEISAKAQELFDTAASNHLHLSLFKLPIAMFPHTITQDADHVVCLRTCMMKPEHLDWLDRIWELLDQSLE